VDCFTGESSQGKLSWKNGGQSGTTSPFLRGNLSSFDFPNGLLPDHYGVFVCTWIHGNRSRHSQNYIVEGMLQACTVNNRRMLNHAHFAENPFAGSPDGSVIMQTLYNPITFDVHYGAIPHVYDSALVVSSQDGVNNPAINVSVEYLYLSIWVEYTNVVYSLSGNYVANITSTSGDHPDLAFEFVIEIEGNFCV